MMEKVIYTVLNLFFTVNCLSQKPMYNNFNYGDEDGVYYKDIDNDFNRFEGVWLYTNGNTSLELRFVKKTYMHIQGLGDNYYTDAIVGEYKFVENGVTIVNTLMNLQANHSNPYNYNITGTRIKRYGDVNCGECGPNEVQIICSFSDPERNIEGSSPVFNMRHYLDNGIENLDVYFKDSGNITTTNGQAQVHTSYRIPYGSYILTKQ